MNKYYPIFVLLFLIGVSGVFPVDILNYRGAIDGPNESKSAGFVLHEIDQNSNNERYKRYQPEEPKLFGNGSLLMMNGAGGPGYQNRFDQYSPYNKFHATAEPERPDQVELKANYPNPFNNRATIVFRLSEAMKVNLGVYNLTGRRVALLIDGFREKGNHRAIFYATQMASGVYFYCLKTEKEIECRKMLLIK